MSLPDLEASDVVDCKLVSLVDTVSAGVDFAGVVDGKLVTVVGSDMVVLLRSASLIALSRGFFAPPHVPEKSSVSMDHTMAPARPRDRANRTFAVRL